MGGGTNHQSTITSTNPTVVSCRAKETYKTVLFFSLRTEKNALMFLVALFAHTGETRFGVLPLLRVLESSRAALRLSRVALPSDSEVAWFSPLYSGYKLRSMLDESNTPTFCKKGCWRGRASRMRLRIVERICWQAIRNKG